MKNLSAALMGFVPALLLWRLGAIARFIGPYFTGSFAAVLLCLLIYSILSRWHHGGVLVLLALGIPFLSHVYVAALYPLLLPLFFGVGVLILLTALVGSMLGDVWTWQGVGTNLAFLITVAFLIVALGGRLDILKAEAGLLAAGAFAITRLCQIDLLSWLALLPGWIYRGLEKILR